MCQRAYTVFYGPGVGWAEGIGSAGYFFIGVNAVDSFLVPELSAGVYRGF